MQPYLQYIVLLGAVVIVGAFVMPRKKQETALPSQSTQNMEIALEQFMENMEKDNDELVLLVKNAQQQSKSDTERMELKMVELERKCELLNEQLQISRSQAASVLFPSVAPVQEKTQMNLITDSEIIIPIIEETPSANTIHSRYKELFTLYGQGKSIEAISKKLGMNKGEVQLIIQLAKQEDAAHA